MKARNKPEYPDDILAAGRVEVCRDGSVNWIREKCGIVDQRMENVLMVAGLDAAKNLLLQDGLQAAKHEAREAATKEMR